MNPPQSTFAVAIVAFAVTACASTVAYTSGSVSSITRSGPLSLRLEAPAVVAGWQPVPLRMVLKNVSNDTVLIVLSDIHFQQTDYVVTRWSHQVWEKNWHRGGEGAALEIVFEPNDSLVYNYLWPQRTNHRWPVGPGKYTVVGSVHVSAPAVSDIVSAPIEVRVR